MYCEECDTTLSPITFKRHLSSNKHIMNLIPSDASIFI
jgi:hypothetical protein